MSSCARRFRGLRCPTWFELHQKSNILHFRQSNMVKLFGCSSQQTAMMMVMITTNGDNFNLTLGWPTWLWARLFPPRMLFPPTTDILCCIDMRTRIGIGVSMRCGERERRGQRQGKWQNQGQGRIQGWDDLPLFIPLSLFPWWLRWWCWSVMLMIRTMVIWQW